MARNRPGKRERMNAKRGERKAIMYANAQEAKAAKPTPCGPQGFRASITSRDNLRSHSHDIGFVGPRGFHTPKDTLSRAEKTAGLLAGPRRTSQERQEALALAASVSFARPTQKD